MHLCVITDEISQDLDHALDVCEELGINTVELRAVGGANVVSHDEAGLARMVAAVENRGVRVGAIASPFLKCHIHGDGVPRGAAHSAAPATREEQWAVLERSFEVARLFSAPLVRAFSFWRVEDPTSVREEVARVLAEAADRTAAAGLVLGIENEHACNLATGEETGWALDRIPSPSLGVIWDPGNEAAVGSEPYPGGYAHVRERVVHVHLKDMAENGEWTRLGAGTIDYVGQLRALGDDGYAGLLSLETHYEKRPGGQEAATRESVGGLRALCRDAGVELTG